MSFFYKEGGHRMKRPTVLSLFSGCGGMDLGFTNAGFEIVWANDINKSAAYTYRENIGNHIIEKDIKEIKKNEFPDNIDVVIGGFPCQGFSMAGKRDINDERNQLYKEMKRVVDIVKPKYFIAENVRGLLSMLKGEVIKHIIKDFTLIGYKVDFKLLYAPFFRVPQERYRVFIIGNRIEKENPFPEENTIPENLSVRNAIGDLEELGGLPNHEIISKWPNEYNVIMNYIGEGQKLCNSRHGASSVYTWDIPEVYGEVTEQEKEILVAIAKNRRHKKYGDKDGNPLSISVISELTSIDEEIIRALVNSLISKEYLVEKTEGKYDITKANFARFNRLSWDTLSPTILTNFDNPRNYVHPSQNRPLSVREVARLQSFPDDFIFYGTLKEQYTQIGNAVPPLLAEAVANAIFEKLYS